MNYYPHKKTLLSVSAESINTEQTGTTYRVSTSENDEVSSDDQDFKVFFHTEQTGGVTNPTVQAHLQTSWDKVNWATVASSTQLTADGGSDEVKPAQTVGPFVRVVTQLGGATNPAHKVEAILISNGRFKIKKVV